MVHEGNSAMSVSEVYRGLTIYYNPSTRRWSVELTPEAGLAEFKSAFQARRAINLALDGQSGKLA